ncbi:transposase-like protein [Paraburkholderia sp. MM5384-R2]|nr:transposase-like protein [Paraburkholderia sp. MM5384-R2]
MKKSNKFSAEVREGAVRMVQEHRGEYPSQWTAIESIAPKIGCTSQRLLPSAPTRISLINRPLSDLV